MAELLAERKKIGRLDLVRVRLTIGEELKMENGRTYRFEKVTKKGFNIIGPSGKKVHKSHMYPEGGNADVLADQGQKEFEFFISTDGLLYRLILSEWHEVLDEVLGITEDDIGEAPWEKIREEIHRESEE